MKRPLAAAAGAFVCFGMFWGSWAVSTAEIESFTGLSDAGLGLLLSCSIAGGGLAAAVVGQRLAHSGPDELLPKLLVPWGVLSVIAAVVPGRYGFVAAFTLAIASAGCVDMAMNAAATVGLGGAAGGMVRFHSLFNAGTLIGAGVVAGLVSGSASWRWTWLVTGVGALGVGAFGRAAAHASARTVRVHAAAESSSVFESFSRIRAEGLVILVVAFATTAIVEGGIDTWGVLYLRTRVATGILVGAGAYAVGQLIACTTRASGATLIERLGHRSGFVLGALLASAGLVVEVTFKSAPVAACALAVSAGGVSLCWPLTMARLAARPQGDGRDTATTTVLVGGFTAAGYMGSVLGPAVVGTLSDHVGLRAGLLLLGALGASAAVVTAATHRPTTTR